ncbi:MULTISPECIES: universal stress protein [Mesorhizobium]|jgi:nucleotide-binding universal stress UspA family protein|uniref:Universal stress protein UspA n=1 Tax=Rhizobium loti TaxID=381 RepID=A0A6M7TZ99_RHILI|nr:MULTISPECIES: universal stress protein [Mesorhizobium]KRB23134.1 universal stress protein UspA [Mesorhizobium sp. Root172]OBQ63187.1 universal stress protein UspA [Mesorhizobium loti]QKC70235.1 universal stress protein [Mesorhizobium loti]QKC89214.1 universal stress protein [Mesorhizobium sp. NZP2234]
MAFKTIMVQLDVDAIAAPRIAMAWNLAQRQDADLIGFCAAEPHFALPAGTDDQAATKALWCQVEEIEGRLDCLREEFLSIVNGSNRASWRGEIGNPTRQLALNARAADLILTGSPTADLVADRHRVVDPASLILAAGRPILVASDPLASIKAESILIAWNDTREARRAVVDAMPFLITAREVVIATVDNGDTRPRENAADVERFLTRHGVKARSEILDARRSEPAEILLQIGKDIAADLIVLGGYGHSRVLEMTFGGVTRSVLRGGSLHRFISN